MDAADFWLPAVVVLGGNSLFFIFCSIVKDNSWIDVFWGLTFIFPIVAIWIKRFFIDDTSVEAPLNLRMILVLVCVSIWGIRLAWHIGRRHTKEYFRYVDMRNNWATNGTFLLYVRFYLNIFVLQGIFSLIVNSSALYVTIYSNTEGLIWTDYLGALIWMAGFIFEWVGDEQLKTHLAYKTPGKEKFIKWGLWRYTRHPNYFGEAVLWWGITLIACSIEWGWLTFYSALFITLLIRYVSGVPFLEEKYKNNPEFQAYCIETNCFVPWFVNKRAQPLAEQSI